MSSAPPAPAGRSPDIVVELPKPMQTAAAKEDGEKDKVPLPSPNPVDDLKKDDQPQHLESAQRVGLSTHVFERTRLADLVGRLEAEGALG